MKTLQASRLAASSSKGADRPIDSFTLGFVRKAARRLAAKYEFVLGDRDEIEQQLYLKLAGHLHQADPDDHRWKAFVATTVSRHIASMIRDATAEKRDHRRTTSIHVMIGSDEDGPIELADAIAEDQTPARRSQHRRSEQELAELQIDMAACIDGLCDGRHRELCERLKGDSVAQVARDMGIARTTLNAWLANLRICFEEHGLRDYLERGSSVR